MDVFWFSFFIFTLMHPIGDFIIGDRRKWKGEFWLVINPLHWLWDLSPLRQHHKYIATRKLPALSVLPKDEPLNPHKKDYWFIPDQDILFTSQFLTQEFWFWLGVDQLAHVILNVVMAGILEIIF